MHIRMHISICIPTLVLAAAFDDVFCVALASLSLSHQSSSCYISINHNIYQHFPPTTLKPKAGERDGGNAVLTLGSNNVWMCEFRLITPSFSLLRFSSLTILNWQQIHSNEDTHT